MQLHAKHILCIYSCFYCGIPHHTIFNLIRAAILSIKIYFVIIPKIYCLSMSLETQRDVFYQVHVYKLDLSLYLHMH